MWSSRTLKVEMENLKISEPDHYNQCHRHHHCRHCRHCRHLKL